ARFLVGLCLLAIGQQSLRQVDQRLAGARERALERVTEVLGLGRVKVLVKVGGGFGTRFLVGASRTQVGQLLFLPDVDVQRSQARSIKLTVLGGENALQVDLVQQG